MAKAEPRPSTRNSRIAESDAGTAARQTKTSTPGTGQHVRSSTMPVKGASITRADLSPSKKGSVPGPSSGDERTSYRSQSQSTSDSQRTTTAPEPKIPGYVMFRDSGAKTARERDFADWSASAKSPLDGSQERAFFPSPLERGTQAEIAKGDKYTGSDNTVTKPNRQAQ